MLDRGELTRVTADPAMAHRLVEDARRHLISAERIADSDPSLAYAAIHDAVRKSLSAMLQAQGLRPTTKGGHLAVQHAIRAQFEVSMGALLRPVDRIRVTRHATEYPDASTWVDEDAAQDDLPAAQAIVEAAAKAIEHLPVYTAWNG